VAVKQLRCRLEASTTSKSTMPIFPTPPPQGYMAAGEAESTGASRSTLEASSLRWPATADLGQDEVAA